MDEIKITNHARERMNKYQISEELILVTILRPDSVVESYEGKKIFQKALNDHLLRVIIEEHIGSRTIVTTYKARVGRYAV